MAKHPDSEYIEELTGDGHRDEADGQRALAGTPEPVAEELDEFLAITVPKHLFNMTEAREILSHPEAALEGVKATITYQVTITGAGGLKKMAKRIERPVSTQIDGASIKVKG